MKTKLSNGAVQLLDVITKMPGHFRDDYMLAAGIKRAMWNKLSGELRRNGSAYADRATINRNGKTTTDFRWYAGTKPTGKSRARNTTKKPPAFRRGKVRASAREEAVKSKPEKKVPTKTLAKESVKKPSNKFSAWSAEELEMLHKLWKQGLSDKQIEAKIGRTAWAIRGKRKTERWVAERGKKNPPAKKAKAVQPEPLYEVTIVDNQQMFKQEIAEETSEVSITLQRALIGLDEAIIQLVNKEVKQACGELASRLDTVENRLNALEASLSENSEADQATINVIGELEKTLSALEGTL